MWFLLQNKFKTIEVKKMFGKIDLLIVIINNNHYKNFYKLFILWWLHHLLLVIPLPILLFSYSYTIMCYVKYTTQQCNKEKRDLSEHLNPAACRWYAIRDQVLESYERRLLIKDATVQYGMVEDKSVGDGEKAWL